MDSRAGWSERDEVPSSGQDLLQGPLRQTFARLAWPAVAAHMSQMLFDLVDGAWVGRLAPSAMAGQGAAVFLFWAAFTVCQLPAVGAGALVAQSLGRRDEAEARSLSGAGGLLALLVGLAVTLALWLGAPPIFAAMGLGPEAALQAQRATRVMAVFAPVTFAYQVGLALLNARGSTREAFAWMAVTLAANALLDPLLIFGWGPIPRLEVAGASLASGLCQALAALALLGRLVQRGQLGVAGARSHLARVARLGAPVAANQLVFSLVYPVLASFLSGFGDLPLAALNLCHRLEGVAYFSSLGLSVATATLVGQHHGAGSPGQAAASLREGMRLATLTLLPISLAFLLLPELLLRAMTDRAGVVEAGALYLRVIGPSEVFLGFEVVILGALAGMGRTLPQVALAMPLTLARIPLAWLGLRYGPEGPLAVWIAISASTVLKGGLLLALALKVFGREVLPGVRVAR